MTALPTVSAVVPTRCRPGTATQVRSLLRDAGLLEVVVVVDGPDLPGTDDLRCLAREEPRLVLVELPENVGPSRARSAGGRAAAGDVLLVLDDDVAVDVGLAALHARAHAAESDLVLLGHMPVDPQVRSHGGSAAGLLYAQAYDAYWQEVLARPERVLERLWAGHFSVPRAAFVAVPESDLDIRYLEDVDLGLRLREAGLHGRADAGLRSRHLHARAYDKALAEAAEQGRSLRLLQARWPQAVGPLPAYASNDGPLGLFRLLDRPLLQRVLPAVLLVALRLLAGLRLRRAETLVYRLARRQQFRQGLQRLSPLEPVPGRPRVLVVTDEPGWPVDSGYRGRVAAVLGALHRRCEVQVLVLTRYEDQLQRPAAPVAARVDARVARRLPLWRAGLRWATSRQPRVVAARDWGPARRALRSLPPDSVDLVWFEHPEVWSELASACPAAPHVLDLDNVMSRLYERLALAARGTVRSALLRADATRWAELEHRALSTAHAVCVSSEHDRDELGPPAAVLPNCYAVPAPLPQRAASPAPVLLFVATMHYEPNADGVLWFSREVLPLVRQAVPGARFRVVGDHGQRRDVLRAGREPGVELVGFLPEPADVLDELARCAAVVVPLRAGAGTRIKVLEAFACAVPVVSTTTGAEGIVAEPGRDLMLADGATDLAAACVALLQDQGRAHAVGLAGRAVYEARYDPVVLDAHVADLLSSLGVTAR